MIGSTLGHYRIEARLGAGGMGEVYRARDLKLDRPVALKFVQPDLAGDPDALRRFEHEARALAALDHPYVGAVHGVEQHEGRTFMVLALVEGESLEALAARGPVPAGRARVLLQRIAEGLEAAHARGIVHRDIKLANVMVGPGDMPRIVDFGIAMRPGMTRLTEAGHWVGTAGFTAPESYRGEPATPRSDLFSLGVVAYRMLTGRAPWSGDTPAAVMHGVMKEPPPPFPASLGPAALELEPIVRRCLEKEPARRFARAADFAAAMHSDPTAATSAPTRAMPATSRRRVSILAAVATLVIAAAAVFVLLRGGSGPRPRADAVAERPNSVAILEFENLSGNPDLDWMKRGIAELLSTALAQSPTLDVYDAQRLVELAGFDPRAAAMGGAELPGITTASLARFGIQRAITGSVLRSGNRLSLQGRLVNVGSGRVIRAVSADGPLDGDLFELVGRIIPSLQVALEVHGTGDTEAEAWLREITTPSAEAYRAYLAGHQALVAAHWVEAERHLSRAVALDSNFVAAWTDLVGTYWNLDSPTDLDRARARLTALRSRSDSRALLRIDQMDAIIEGNPAELIRTSEALIRLYPENRFYRYLLGRGHFTAGNDRSTLATLEPLSRQGYEWPWTYMLMSRAYVRMEQPDSAEAALRHGLQVTKGNPEISFEYARRRAARGDRAGTRAILETTMRSTGLAETPLWRARIQHMLGRMDAEDGAVDSARVRLTRALPSLPEESGERAQARRLLDSLAAR